jgi:hypothetical protein
VLESTYHHMQVRRFATEVVGPKVRDMDEKESMDPAIIKGLFEQGVSFSTLLTHVVDIDYRSEAHGYRNERRAWGLRILVHVSHYCRRGAGKSRPLRLRDVRRAQHTREHYRSQARNQGTTEEIHAPPFRIQSLFILCPRQQK